MAHKKYIVKQGDCISSIAMDYGHFPDTLWNDQKNKELKENRKDPNILLPGDIVYIRDIENKTVSCATEQKHRFRRKAVPEKLRIQFEIGNKPRANEAYSLVIDGKFIDKTTDKDGWVEIPIPPNATKGKIRFHDTGDEYEIELGELDPVTEISGIQGRLKNLEFYNGDVDGKINSALEISIGNFQKQYNLEETGKPDKSLQDKLQEVYGS